MNDHNTTEPSDVEASTRETYSMWMKNGLEVVKSLIEDSDPKVLIEDVWPRRAISKDGQWTTWRHRAATIDALTNAHDAGWIVTGPPIDDARPTTDHADGPDHGRLRGLTVTVKDIIDVAGLPTRNGTPGALWKRPAASAAAWELLEKSGAECAGKSATHEMAWGVTTPQIGNPIDERYFAGGSSGGAAASVAGGATQGALGTDTGGSIRIPAALCGVVGFRPTGGSIDMEGITPLAPSQDIVGPIANDVATCTAMLEVLLGRPLGTAHHDAKLADGTLRIGVLARPGRLQPEVEEPYRRMLDLLTKNGADIVECEPSAPRRATGISLLTMLHESANLYAQTAVAEANGFGGEARALLTLGNGLDANAQDIDRARRIITQETAGLFEAERLDALVTPTTPCVAPPRCADSVDIGGRLEPVSAALTRFTAWASVTQMPAMSVPLPTENFPASMQVMAPPLREDVCIKIAQSIERLSKE